MSSDLTFNKIAGGLLAAALAIFSPGEFSNIVFKSEPRANPGYAIAVQEASEGGGEAADVIPDWGTVLPTANAAAGAAVAEKGKSCHNLANGGPNPTGPHLCRAEKPKSLPQPRHRRPEPARPHPLRRGGRQAGFAPGLRLFPGHDRFRRQ